MTTNNIKDQYRIIPDPKFPEKWCVELLLSSYRGIIFSFGKFTDEILEKEAIYIPSALRQKQLNKKEIGELNLLLADILLDIIESNKDKIEIVNDKLVLKVGTEHFKQPDIEVFEQDGKLKIKERNDKR